MEADRDAEETLAPDAMRREADTIGPYRLLQLIGAGGMGDVWLAEQVRPVRRQVALKVIKAGMDTAQVVARFELERQALALMDHPGIARVLDAGATPQGRPYFVMEYVRGESVTAYCTRHKVSLRERLELFAQVCDAVQHAHQKGIIHRDLKPSNVLVAIQDDRPVPKIIDFGVAKATARTLPEQPLHTEFGAIVGTPEYMSPEQAEMTGLDVDTRTDVYALGVMLYELLTGTLPFEPAMLRSKGFEEVRRTIREVEPPPPSARVVALPSAGAQSRAETSRLAAQLRRDLDWITMKALDKDRVRRYQTANAFALDVRRHLSGEPVLAAPSSKSYRLGKFVRRNRVGVAVGAGLACLVVAFAMVTGFQARRVALERDRADREATVARAISEFLRDDLLKQAGASGQAAPGSGVDPNLTVRTALDRAAERLPGKFGTEPEVEASLRDTIGDTYRDLGLYAEAERHLDAASRLRILALGRTHPDTLGTMASLGDVYRLAGKYDEAERTLKEVLAEGRLALGDDDDQVVAVRENLGIVYRYLARYDEAEALYAANLEIEMRRGNGDPLPTMNNLGMLHQLQGKYDAADALLARGIELASKTRGRDHPVTLTLMNNQALSYTAQGKFDQAETLALTVLKQAQRVWGEQHPNTLQAMSNLGSIYTSEGKYSQAALLLGEALAIGKVLGDDHRNTLLARIKLAQLYVAQGRYGEAESLSRATVEGFRQVLGADHPDALAGVAVTGDALVRARKDQQAEALLTGLVASRRRVLGNRHPDTLATMLSLGSVLVAERKYSEAERTLRETVEEYTRLSTENWLRYFSESMLALSLAGQRRYGEAEPLLLSGYEGLVRLRDRMPADRRSIIVDAGDSIPRLYQDSGQAAKAAEWRDRLAKVEPRR